MGLTGTIRLNQNLSQGYTGIPGRKSVANTVGYGFTVASGTSADQCDTYFANTYTLTGSPTVLDFTALVNALGTTTFAKVKELVIVNNSTTDGQTLKVGFSSMTSNAWVGWLSNPGQILVGPSTTANDGFFCLVSPNTSGFPVSSTSKLLQLDPGANTFTVDVIVAGTSV